MPQEPLEHEPLVLQVPREVVHEIDSVLPLIEPVQLELEPSPVVPLSETLLPLMGPLRRVPAVQDTDSVQLDWVTWQLLSLQLPARRHAPL